MHHLFFYIKISRFYICFGPKPFYILLSKNPSARRYTMSLINKSKVKEIVPGFNVSSDVYEALNKKCEQLLRDGVERAKANNRRTLMGKDL